MNLDRPARTRRRTLLVVILTALSVARMATYWRYTEAPFRTANDFSPDYVSAREWMAGRDPYAPLAGLYDQYFGPGNTRLVVEPDQLNPHPPILIVLAAPLARVGLGPARGVLIVLALLAIFLAMMLLCRELSMSPHASIGVAAVVLALPLVDYEIRWAQTNAFILLALVWGWRKLRRGGERGAGIALGLAAAIKLFPWVMVVPLIRQRRFLAVWWMLGSAAVASVIGVVALGSSAAVRFATEATSRNVEAWGAAPNGISLITLPFRLFASDRWLHPGVPVALWISLACLVVLCLCFAGAALTRASASGDVFWATVPWLILGSPIAWPHYLVLAIPLGFLVLARGRLGLPARATAVLAVLVLGIASPFSEWWPRVGYGWMVIGSTVLMASLGCLAALDFTSSPAPAHGVRTEPPLLSARALLEAWSRPARPR